MRRQADWQYSNYENELWLEYQYPEMEGSVEKWLSEFENERDKMIVHINRMIIIAKNMEGIRGIRRVGEIEFRKGYMVQRLDVVPEPGAIRFDWEELAEELMLRSGR